MKSLRVNSNDSRNKSFKKPYISAKKDNSFDGRPTPIDFDSFIPWFCLELQLSKNIIVTRTNQAEYIRYEPKLSRSSKESTKSSNSKSKSTKIRLNAAQSRTDEKKISSLPKISFATRTVDIKDAIPVTTSYDKRGRLVEILILGCPFAIPRKVIQAFNLCLPFHSGLSKLSIRRGGVCPIILYEISKLLPHSNITEICLDDSYVPAGNYSILLDRPSQIKYLSLKRCGINDEECKNIAAKLDLKGPAVKSLSLLDLTSNNITDEGAQAIGDILKNNRNLMYLNLSGNNISDTGASFILQYLQEFPLTCDDIKEKKRRRIDYLISRRVYEKCLEEVKLSRLELKSKKDLQISSDQSSAMTNVTQQCRRKKNKRPVIPSFVFEEIAVEEDAENRTKEIVGEFEDPFADKYIRREGDFVYGIGNLTLSYLNLAYNNLSLLSVRKILKILKYQCGINKLNLSTGLVRVVIEGNNIPTQCDELVEIDLCLKTNLLENNFSLTLNKNPLQ